jgi:predicted O-methyltransferase YrrM
MIARALSWLQRCHGRISPNWRGVYRFPPGHFYSPLLNLEGEVETHPTEHWEHLPLRQEAQISLYRELASQPPLKFPEIASSSHRYHSANGWFPLADAFLLSGIVRKVKPARLIEVGSGFSTAVVLDTLDQTSHTCELTLIEPDPARLLSLLHPEDSSRYQLHQHVVQEVPIELFDKLDAGDVLFIDSSHVAKAGSDVSHLFLRVLPRLKPGVWVHVHDISWPDTLPSSWVEEGRAWNESLFLRAFLMGNAAYEVRAFHAYARSTFPESAWFGIESVRESTGSSFWMQKVA